MQRLLDVTSGKSVASLAGMLGVSHQAIYNAKNKLKIPKSWLVDVAEATGASVDWLLTGAGAPYARNMTGEPARAGTLRAGQPLTSLVPSDKAEFIDCKDCQLVMVPMVEARLSAGTGSFEAGAGEQRRYAFRSDWINTKGQPSKMVLMRVSGDSMEPMVFNDDVVLVDQSQTTPRAGGLFAVAVEDLVYLKVVDAMPGKFILKSYNEAYAPLEIDARGDLADGIRIIGRAVWVGRELY